MRSIPIKWSWTAIRHAWNDHGVSFEEIQVAEADPRRRFYRIGRIRYKLIAMSRDRMLTLILEDAGDHYRGKTARPADDKEKRLYRRP